jgi:hypothetical protein
MPIYPCPDCGTKLKPANPVPPGKKLRCPECGNVFAPAAAAAARPAPPPAAAPAGDDDEAGSYGLVRDDEGAKTTANINETVFSPIKDRFARSARGPALILVVRPSDWLLRTGVAICIAAVVGALWAIWPLIFKVEIVQPEDKMSKFRAPTNQGRRFKELTDEEWKERWLFLGGFVFQFAWGAVVCTGAAKMHSLESYPLAMIGSAMGMVGPGVPAGIALLNDAINSNEPYYIFLAGLLIVLPGVPIALWCLATLRKKEVIAGFQEEKPED